MPVFVIGIDHCRRGGDHTAAMVFVLEENGTRVRLVHHAEIGRGATGEQLLELEQNPDGSWGPP